MEEFQELHSHTVKHIKKTGNGKEASVTLHMSLNGSSSEVNEKWFKKLDERKAAKAIRKVERPKTGNSLPDVFLSKTDSKKLFKSLEFLQQRALPGNLRRSLSERNTQKKQLENKEVLYCSCWKKQGHEETSLLGLDLRSLSGCGSDTLRTRQYESWSRLSHSAQLRIKCKSNPASSKTTHKKIFDGEKDFHKVKRSLRLLGFELSDFGIRSAWVQNTPIKKFEKPASLTTKITSRSVSLDSLRAMVKRAWMDDRLDESHRRLLAQAAYEEWYFRKESELSRKRNEERLMRLKAEENFRKDFEEKKEKSENEFRKWLQRKRMKRKSKTLEESTPDKQTKTKEESEKAFRNWKKKKQEELRKMEKEKKKEEERRLETEREKNSKKKNAEKVFQLWKTKLETKLQEEMKREKQKKKQELQEREKKDEGFHISFEKWKTIKDKQIKEKIKQTRLACRTLREKRLEQMEERMYKADQAFEDWLEKLDSQKQKQCSEVNTCNKIIPWIPA